MSAARGQPSLVRQARREVMDVPETRPPDRSLDMLIKLRKQRIERYEQDRRIAREEWREQRAGLNDAKQRRRQALQDAKDYWQQARAGFLSMVMTSGQYQKAKAIYKRMKEHAASIYTECLEAVRDAKSARERYFEACRTLSAARRQHEKLDMMRDEMRALNRQFEA